MPITILTITNQRLQPALYPGEARLCNGKFAASKQFLAGSVIARKTSDGLLYPVGTPDSIQTITPAGTATAGTFTITVTRPTGVTFTTTALAYNASIATIQAALDVASGIANGIVATSSGTAAPFSTPTALILTFSGTGFTTLEQPPVTVDITLLTGTTAAPVTDTQPNIVQTITPTGAAGAGHFSIGIWRPKTQTFGWTGPIAYNASIATIQTALDLASGQANGVVAAGVGAPFSSPNAMTLTYSGSNFVGQDIRLAQVALGGDMTVTTKVEIVDSTVTIDGTETPIGFTEYGFTTDANSQCYLVTGTAAADLIATPSASMPFFISGTFNTADLRGWRDTFLAKFQGARYLNTGLLRIP